MNTTVSLNGIKVLELGSMLAGPFLGTLLADFGAEVIKLEKPGKPDPLREWPPHKGGVPLWWKTMARNKRLATLDVSRPEAHELALRLIGRSDVVIENFRPGTLERWGLAPAQLETKFPRVVWARVSGYGQTGPFSEQGGYATIAECFAGLAAITGFPDRGPMVSAFPLGDYLAGTFGAYGVMVALRERDCSGRGQVVDVSLFEPLMRILESLIVSYDQTGQTKPRRGNQMEEDVPRNIYATADGDYIAISCGSQRIFENLIDAIGCTELRSDRRFASMSARAANRVAIDGIVAEWIARQPTEAALATLLASGVVAGKVNDIAEALSHPQVVARAAVVSIADAELGAIRMPAPAPHLDRTPGKIRWAGGCPGADNDYVFAEVLAIAKGEVERLQQIGVI
jgi:succinyl-CoA--D-citramalate CoA-transferase